MRTGRAEPRAVLPIVSLLAACLLSGCTSVSSPSASPPPAVTSAASAGVSGPSGGAASQTLGRSAPVRLRISGIGVDTPVVPLGLQADGTVQVPPVATHAPAGWYQGSPTPGQLGPSVLLGHVTVGRYGDGVFRHLAELRTGARVTVTLRNGREVSFTVYAVRTVAKDHFPTREVYGDVARAELRLITCGGPRTADGYADNVVVFAARSGG